MLICNIESQQFSTCLYICRYRNSRRLWL